MRMIRMVTCALLLLATTATAAEKASRESVEKLMELTKVSSMVEAMYAEVGKMFEGVAEQMGVTETERPAVDKYMKKVVELMQEEMSWSELKEPTMDIYVRNFSEEEIQGLIEFYSSDVGKSMIEKMPVVMQESMGISQGMLKDAMPKIHALAREMQSEIAASRKESEAE